MATIDISTELAQIVNGLANDATDVSSALSKIIAQVNGNLDSDNIKAAALLTATTHGDLSTSTNKMHSAASSSITDTGAYFNTSNVETTLAAIGALLNLDDGSVKGSGAIPRFVGYDTANSVAGCSVSVPADSATTNILVLITMNLSFGNNQNPLMPLTLNKDGAGAVALSQFGNYDDRYHFIWDISSTVSCQFVYTGVFVINSAELATNPNVTTIDLTEENTIGCGTVIERDTGNAAANTTVHRATMLVFST